MKFLVTLLLSLVAYADNIPPQDQERKREPFRLIVDPQLSNLTTGKPFGLKYTILPPKYLSAPRKSVFGPKYDINPFSIEISFESTPRPNQYENRHIWYSEFWPVGNLDFEPGFKFVLPHHLPGGLYRFAAKFTNLSDREKEFDIAYSFVVNLKRGTESRYDQLFDQNRRKGTKNDSSISILEEVRSDGSEWILSQQKGPEGKYDISAIGEKSKYIF